MDPKTRAYRMLDRADSITLRADSLEADAVDFCDNGAQEQADRLMRQACALRAKARTLFDLACSFSEG